MKDKVMRTLLGGAAVDGLVADAALTGLRVFAGLSLALAHGLGKLPPAEKFVGNVESMGFPMPIVFAWSAGLSEFLGGLFVAAGLATRPAAFFATFTMVVAALGAHAGDPYKVREMALLYGAIMLTFVFVGSGRFGADALLRRKFAPPA